MKHAVPVALIAVGLAAATLIWINLGSESRSNRVGPDAREKVLAEGEAPELESPPEAPAIETPPETPREVHAVPDPVPVAAPAEAITLLRVRVLAKEDRAPQKELRIGLQLRDTTSFSCDHATGQRGKLGECPTTGADGLVEFEVEPDRAYLVRALERADRVEQEVDSLALNELREVELLIRTQPDVILFGRLVDAETRRPLGDGTVAVEGKRGGFRIGSGARAKSAEQGDTLVRVDHDGRFELRGKSWERHFVNATAPGYARSMFALALGHSDPATPLEVRLHRSATVDALVRDAAGPIADARVELSTDSYQLQQDHTLHDFHFTEDPSWSAKTDTFGQASVSELPPRVPLRLVISAPKHPTREEPAPISLEPGERRAVEIRFGSGGVVQGQIVDGKNQPLQRVDVWRMACDGPPLGLFGRYETPSTTARTDEHGKFRFDDVASGSWWVGLAPKNPHFPAYKQAVQVKGGDVVDVLIRVDADLFLRGTVIDPGGAPAASCAITALLNDAYAHIIDAADESGRFALGPLPAGEWELAAGAGHDEHAPSAPIRVKAGTDGIVLQLRTGGSILGSVVDAETRESVDAELTLARIDTEHGGWRRSSENGVFEFRGMLPGTYVVFAQSRTGAIAVRGPISLAEGQTVESVELLLVRGATLRLRYEGDTAYGMYAIYCAGLPFRFDGIEKGGDTSFPVVAGPIEVRWTARELQTKKTQTLSLAVGETRELVWDGKP